MVQQKGVNLQDPSNVSRSVNINQPTRILLLGDSGVGKTSLVYSLRNEILDDFKHSSALSEVNIVANIGSERVSITITDFSQRNPSQEDLALAIQKAEVICIVYISGSRDSLDRVAKHWMPTVRDIQKEHGLHKPMLLVANKIDQSENHLLLNKLNDIRQKYLEVENFVEVSAVNHTNIFELISAAQEAVIYPLAPLFDPLTRNLTPKCREVLSEIFSLCDQDGDKLLNDYEINQFQESCFGTPLKQDALEELKNIIRQSSVDSFVNNALTLDGFLFLHALSIDEGRQDFTWEVLKKYNYDNQLNLRLDSSLETEGSSSNPTDENPISSLTEDTKKYLRIDPRSTIRGRKLISQLDIAPWLRDNPRMVKTGLGLTVTTFISFMVLKFIMQNISKS